MVYGEIEITTNKQFFYLSIRLDLIMVCNGYPVSSSTSTSGSDYFKSQVETVVNRQQTVITGSHIKLRYLNDVEWARHCEQLDTL